MFRDRVFTSAVFSLFFTFLAYPSYTLIMPFYLMQGRGVRPTGTGVFMAIVSMGTIVFGPISGWLSDRFGPVWFATLGALISAVSFGLMQGFGLDTGTMYIVLVLLLYGLGVGLFQPPNNSTIMGVVPRERLGTASAMIATQRSVALSLGTAVAGLLFSLRLDFYQGALSRSGLAAAEAARQAIPPAFHEVLAVFMFASLVSAALALAAKGARHPGGGRV